MFADLHIHSCLSPCSDDSMTINNIIQMALLKELSLIAITDHNSTKNLPCFDALLKKYDIKGWYGIELQTIEEVHVLAYFSHLSDALAMQPWIDRHLQKVANKPDYFGNQLIVNENDEVIEHEEYLLLSSINATLEQCIEQIHQCRGKAVLAHVFDRANSITHQLGFIPKTCKFDGLELKDFSEKEKIKSMYPWIDTVYFFNSDAHQLIDINEATFFLKEKDIEKFWGNCL